MVRSAKDVGQAEPVSLARFPRTTARCQCGGGTVKADGGGSGRMAKSQDGTKLAIAAGAHPVVCRECGKDQAVKRM